MVAFLRLEFVIGNCGAPLFERDHVGPATADRNEGSGGDFNNNMLVLIVGRAGSIFCMNNYLYYVVKGVEHI